MQSIDPETGKNQSRSMVPIPGITLSESWRSAFGKLSAGCLSDARAVILIGERGVGKASLIEAWREQSASTFYVVSLNEATGEPDQVVANLAHLMGVDTADLGRGAILSAITAAVQSNRQAGKETVVIVDNADDVPSNTVELLMILARDRGTNKPLLRYIFSGSNKLRKTLRLDGGAARRQNYVTVEMERFTPDQTKAFVSANLSRASDVTIADDAAIYLHESTSGKPANILTVLEKVQQGRMGEGETEITKAHIQSLVKAPRPIGPAPKKPQPTPDMSLVDGAPTVAGASTGSGSYSKSPQEGLGQKSFAEPGNVFATNADLPDSIRNVNDPRPLLRWAFGLEEHSETEALANRAEASAAAARADNNKSANAPSDLNAALAQVAERERAERNPQPEVLRAVKPGAEGTLDHMIQSEAFTFEEEPASAPRTIRNPDELNVALREVPATPPRRTNKLVFAAGVAVMGVAALGVLWTALQPTEIVNPLDGIAGSDQTAAISPTVEAGSDTPIASSDASVSASPNSETTATAAVGSGEPDLAGVIALMKSPDFNRSGTSTGSALQPFRDNTPRIISTGYLPATGLNSSTENAGLRQAIVADMAAAERVGLAGEEKRLMEQLTQLEAQVTQKQSVLSSLERAINAMSTQAQQSGDLIDNRRAEIEVVTSRLAFMARDRAQAAQRLATASTQAQTAEEKLQVMRDELAAAEELISENKALLDENQTTTANLGEAVAKREADFAELTRKVAEAETLLTEHRDELAAVLAQQERAKTELVDLEGQLETAKAAQAEIEAESTRLQVDRDAQIASSESLNEDVSKADARLATANAELAEATAALSERTAALGVIATQSSAAQSELDALVSELDDRRSVVATSNQELDTLTSQRETLEVELAAKAAQIEKANGQLEVLETSQQTASSEFEALIKRREALQADLETGEVVLETLSAELNSKQSAVDALESELDAGTARIAAQRDELDQLKTQSAGIVAAQSTAQAAVTAEQDQVASAANDLDALKSQQVQMAAALDEIENLTVVSQRDLDTIRANKAEAERDIAATVQRLKDIKAQEVAAEKGLSSFAGEFAAKQEELEALEGRISSSNEELAAVSSKKAALNAQLTELTNAGTAKLREQQAQLDQTALQLEEKQAALASLTKELSDTQAAPEAVASTEAGLLETATVPAIRVRPTSSTSEPTTTAILDRAETAVEETSPQAGIGLAPRNADLVISALLDAPGLGRAPQDKKDQLQAALIRGECVTDALKDTFGRVNPHTLVALLETMEMCGS